MGHRANFVVIQNRRREIWYSHWGALSVPQDLFFGPEPALAYIRSLGQAEALLDDLWCEGAALLDFDAHTLLLFGGESLFFRPPVRRVFLALMRTNWPGWEVRWTAEDQVTIADYLGETVGLLRGDFDDDFDAPPTAAHIRRDRATHGKTLLTVRDASGDVRDYRFDLGAPNLLGAGPLLLDWLANRPTVPLPDEGDERIIEGALVDAHAGEIWVWRADRLDRRWGREFADIWPGFRIHSHMEGVILHAVFSGRGGQMARVDEAAIIEQLRPILTRESPLEPGRLLHDIVRAGSEVECKAAPRAAINPAVHAHARLPLSLAERAETFARSVEIYSRLTMHGTRRSRAS